MAKTMKWPPEFTGTGGMRLFDDIVDITAQLVGISCIPGRSANAWDEEEGAGYTGGGYEVAGTVDDAALTGSVRDRFRFLERAGVARLLSNPTIQTDGAGVRTISFEYFDLRAQRQRTAKFDVNGGTA